MTLVRTLYLYLFSFIGLIVAVVGCIQLLDMAMKALIFTQADKEQYMYNSMPPCGALDVGKLKAVSSTDTPGAEDSAVASALTEDEKAKIVSLLADYDNWQKQREKIDPVTAQRQRTASNSLAMIFIGLPLYLFHWRLIQKEGKETKNKE